MEPTSPSLRCPCCSGVHFTQPGFVTTTGSQAGLLQFNSPGFFSKSVTVQLTGRACMHCGYVMLFGDMQAIAEVANTSGG